MNKTLLQEISNKLPFVKNPGKFYNIIDQIVLNEQNDNEYMKDYDIMFISKLDQIKYFCNNAEYKRKFEKNLNEKDIIMIYFLEQYDYELFQDEWKNEMLRLKSTIVDNKEPNTNDICNRCNKQTVYMTARQIRSGDEGDTKFFTCLSCGNKWTQQG